MAAYLAATKRKSLSLQKAGKVSQLCPVENRQKKARKRNSKPVEIAKHRRRLHLQHHDSALSSPAH